MPSKADLARRAKAAPVPEPEPDTEYPKQMYHSSGKTKRVEDADDEKALGAGWSDDASLYVHEG